MVVAQLVRVLVCGAEGRGFEPHQVYLAEVNGSKLEQRTIKNHLSKAFSVRINEMLIALFIYSWLIKLELLLIFRYFR